MSWRAIGIFDSGVGGLTVLRELARALPQEDTIYFGDTARVPYGTKSPDTVIRYSQEIASFLMTRDIKLLVVACNTASAVALPALRRQLPIPVVGVIEPGARRAVEVTRSGVVGVIGTAGTIRSSAYSRAIKRLNPTISVLAKPCPLFVPLAEEGWTDNEIARLTAHQYLDELRQAGSIRWCWAAPTTRCSKRSLPRPWAPRWPWWIRPRRLPVPWQPFCRRKNLLRPAAEQGNHHYYVTDVPAGFIRVGNRFLGGKLGDVYQVSLDDCRLTDKEQES